MTYYVDSQGKVELKFTGVGIPEAGVAPTDKNDLNDKVKAKFEPDGSIYLEFSIEKKVFEWDEQSSGIATEPSSVDTITQVPSVLKILITLPEEIQGMAQYTIVRMHEGQPEPLGTSGEERYELIKENGRTVAILIYSKKFSLYAIAYTSVQPPKKSSDDVVSTYVKSSGGKAATYTPPQYVVRTATTESVEKPAADYSDVSRLLITDDHIAYITGRGGNEFAPNENMTRAEVAQMFYNLLRNKTVVGSKTFPDVPAEAWYGKAVNSLTALGVISGYTDGMFRPDKNITRAEFTAIAVQFAKVVPSDLRFADVPESHWAYDYINTAAGFGWIAGTGSGMFEPNRSITRAEAVTLTNKMLKRYPDSLYIDSNRGLTRFADVLQDHWAYYQIAEAANHHDYTRDGSAESWK